MIIEGDCSQVIAALKGFGRCRTLFGHIIDEFKRIGGTLRSCLFQHVRREGNKLAHCLAKKAVLSADTDVWVNFCLRMWKMFSIRICLELVVYFLVLVFLNNISLTIVSKKKKKKKQY